MVIPIVSYDDIYSIRVSRVTFRNTSAAPDTFLREVIRFVKPANTGRVGWWFKGTPTSHFSGTCWGHSQIRCRIPKPRLFTSLYNACTAPGYLPWGAATWEEAVVAICAHEVRHAWQYRNPRGQRVWGAKGRSSERDCDAYAIRMMRKWRRTHPARVVAQTKGTHLARYRVLSQAA